MHDSKHARQLMTMANKDFKALTGMLDTELFHEEIFGFHAQQAVEKALKAWIALSGIEYPKTHNLSLLLNLLKDQGVDTSPFEALTDYTPFGVHTRYDALDESDEPIDRQGAIEQVRALIQYVEQTISESESRPDDRTDAET